MYGTSPQLYMHFSVMVPIYLQLEFLKLPSLSIAGDAAYNLTDVWQVHLA